MDREQASAIIFLLGAIFVVLFFMLVGKDDALEFQRNFLWIGLAIFIVAAVVFGIRDSFLSWLADSHARKEERLDAEINELVREISCYPGPRLTTENIPQRFRSEAEAYAFGMQWARGGPESFHTEGSLLHAPPALFYGMSEAHSDDPTWWLDFLRAKKRWLTDYRDLVGHA